MMVERDFGFALNPVEFARKRLGFEPDPKQTEVLKPGTKRGILNCSRQWGKSTVSAVLGVHRAYYTPGTVVVVASPCRRQSEELVLKMRAFLGKLGIGRGRRGSSSLHSLLLPNGSRIIGLPGSADNIRGYSASLVLIDEAARVSDEVYAAVQPMLAAGKATSSGAREPGDLWLMSTPFGKRGFFYEQWAFSPLPWRRISVPATECSRISKEFLEEARIDLGEARFRQEYMCEFIQNQRSVFLESDVGPCFKDDIPPLWKDRRK